MILKKPLVLLFSLLLFFHIFSLFVTFILSKMFLIPILSALDNMPRRKSTEIIEVNLLSNVCSANH